MERSKPGQPASFGSLPLCLARGAGARVVKVEVMDTTGGIRVDAFGLRRVDPGAGRGMFGFELRSLAAAGLPVGPGR
jgi:hypothetical protein